MAIFNKSQFRTIALSKTSSTRTFSTILNEARLSSRGSSTVSIFLSHAHGDKDLIGQTAAFLKSLNVSIYIDWMDETMPEKTSGVTASSIKSKILQNDKFILLATNTAVASKWCNWEVGIGDAYKLHKDSISLLPLADNNVGWTGNEYLQIYPRIEPVEKNSYEIYDNIFKVKYPDGKEVWLDDWLKKK